MDEQVNQNAAGEGEENTPGGTQGNGRAADPPIVISSVDETPAPEDGDQPTEIKPPVDTSDDPDPGTGGATGSTP